jgi:hypothetical protein
MNEEVKIEFNGEFIEIRHPNGLKIAHDSTETYWTRISDACMKYKCSRVLVEAESPRREMGTMDAFGSGVRASEIAITLSLALCFSNYQPDDLSDFFKTVARNRGVRVEFFSNRKDALKWLGVSDLQQPVENAA